MYRSFGYASAKDDDEKTAGADGGPDGLPLMEMSSNLRSLHQFTAPDSVYGAVALLPVLQEYESVGQRGLDALILYLELAANYATQLFLLYMVNKASADKEEEKAKLVLEDKCENLTWQALGTGLVIFHMTVLVDLLETIDFIQFVYSQPTSKSTLLYKKVQDKVELVSGGLSEERKVAVAICLVLPKFIIAIMLLMCGSTFLASSVNEEEVLLNCVALVFIKEVDELMFYCLNPPYHRRLLAAMPPVVKVLSPVQKRLTIFLKIGFLVASISSSVAFLPNCDRQSRTGVGAFGQLGFWGGIAQARKEIGPVADVPYSPFAT